jgi:aminomethyltransferase
MGQLRITGAKRLQFLETICASDVLSMKENTSKLSVLTNWKGGAIDDFMFSVKKDHIYMVVNAGCKEKDMKHISEQIARFNSEHGADVAMHYHTDRSLIALQGPKAMRTLQSLIRSTVDLKQMPFMTTQDETVAGIKDCIVTRCGYTGEDGFEVSVPHSQAIALWETFLKQEGVLAAGLGVRDSLRLEAGLCLYGHELNEDISPIEAGLLWTMGKRRREEGGFIGANVIQKQIKEGVNKKLLGLSIKAGAPAREGAPVLNDKGETIGVVTSGGPAPSLDNAKIAIAYISTPYATVGGKVNVSVRGKVSPAEIVKMPFTPTSYYRIPTAAK